MPLLQTDCWKQLSGAKYHRVAEDEEKRRGMSYTKVIFVFLHKQLQTKESSCHIIIENKNGCKNLMGTSSVYNAPSVGDVNNLDNLVPKKTKFDDQTITWFLGAKK